MNTMRPMPAGVSEEPARTRGFGLASRVLALLVGFVILAEIAIYVPSIANFRTNWLMTRLSAAYTAALVLEAAPKGMVPAELKRELLDSVGARMIVLQMGSVPKHHHRIPDEFVNSPTFREKRLRQCGEMT